MPIHSEKIRALIFDVDGTLSDTDDRWTYQLEKILKPFSFFIPGDGTKKIARWTIMNIESPMNLIYHWLDHVDLDIWAARTFSYLSQKRNSKQDRKHWLIPGVEEMLDVLAPRFPMAIVSTRDENSTISFLEQFEIRKYFSVIVTALTCRHTKPFPEPVIWASKQLGYSPNECAMIGDTTVDIYAGKAAGAQTVGVLCGFGQENELTKAGADLILPATSSLPDILL